jgi:hypothetical protein
MMTDIGMKVSKETLAILKNFSSMNSNILIHAGNTLRTITPAKNMLAEAKVSETFENEIGIFDLSKFLGTISLFNDPTFTFEDKYVKICDKNNSEVKYYYTEPTLLTTADKRLNMPEPVVSVDISEKQLAEIHKSSSVLQLPNVSIESKDGEIHAVVFEKPTNDYVGSGYEAKSNTYTVVLGPNNNGCDFEYHFQIDNFRFLPGGYSVSLCEQVIGEFEYVGNLNLTYWVAFDTTSRYYG